MLKPFRNAAVVGCFGLVSISASAAVGEKPRDVSWGKAHVAFDQYRSDAIECARLAANTDVADTKPAQTLVTATRELDRIVDALSSEAASASIGATDGAQSTTVASAGAYKHAMEKYRPREQFDAVRTLLYANLDQCLASRGYVRFRLNKAQLKQLRRLKPGSVERREFLHRLASDPEVLGRQKL